MCPLTRLEQGDGVDVTFDNITWWSGTFSRVTPNGLYLVYVDSKGQAFTFPYDQVRPTSATILSHTPIVTIEDD